MTTRSDQQFGDMAIRLGLATPDQVGDGEAAVDAGDSPDLETYLVAVGVLHREDVARIRSVVRAAATPAPPSLRALHTLGPMLDEAMEPDAPLQPAGPTLAALTADLGAGATFGPDGLPSTEPPAALSSHEEGLSVTPEADGRYLVPTDVPDDALVIGQGGIGRVLAVQDEHLGREIALKELRFRGGRKRSTGGTTLTERRFLREARVTGQLEHPSIVPVHELGRRADGTFYYTMKRVRGQDLGEAIAGCRSLAERLKLLPHVVDLCQAIAYAHSRGVVHRDIKPTNVMVGSFGETVVLDWGLAKVRGRSDLGQEDLEAGVRVFEDAAPGATLEGQTLGTPAYMSPEQAMGRIDAIDARSDTWSLGAVLYELLTGRPPFEGDTALEVIEKVAEQAVVPVLERQPDAPPELAAVADKALSRDPDDRYQEAITLAAEVEAFLTGGRVVAYAYTTWELLVRLVERNKALSAVAALLVVVLVVGSGLLYVAWWRALDARVAAETSAAEAEAARADAEAEEIAAHGYLARGYLEKAERLLSEQNPLGARVLAAAALLNEPANPGSPWHDGQVRDPGELAAALQPYRSAFHAAAVDQHVFYRGRMARDLGPEVGRLSLSADGTLLAAAHDGGIAVWSPLDTPIASLEGARPHRVAVSAAGDLLVAVAPDGSVPRWSLPEASPAPPLDTKGLRATDLALSSDGRTLALIGRPNVVAVFDLGEGRLLETWASEGGLPSAVAVSADGSTVAWGTAQGTVHLRPVRWSGRTRDYESSGRSVGALAFTPIGTLVAGDDAGRVVATVPGSRVLMPLAETGSPVQTLASTADGTRVAAGSPDGFVTLIETASARIATRFLAQGRGVGDIAIASDGTLLTAGFDDIGRWQLTAPTARVLRGHGATVWTAQYLDDQVLISGGDDGVVRWWDLQGGAETLAVDLGTPISRIVPSPDATHLAVAPADGQVRILDARRGTELTRLPGHGDRGWDVAFSADGAVVASVGTDTMVQLTDVSSGAVLVSLPFDGHPTTLTWTTGGDALVVGGEEGRVEVYAADGSAQRQRFTIPGGELSSLAASPWPEFVAANFRVGLWSPESGTEVRSFAGPRGWTRQVVVSPSGKLVAGASEDQRVWLWDLASGSALLAIPLGAPVHFVAFAPDEDHVAVGTSDEILLMPIGREDWQLDPQTRLGTAEKEAGLSLEGFTLLPR